MRSFQMRAMGILVGLVLVACNPTPEKKAEANVELKEKKDPIQDSLFQILKEQDRLLFERGFNESDTALLRTLTSEDFEFYHDQGGITENQNDFIHSIEQIGKLSYHATRELDSESLELHLLRNNGEIYGALQMGKHSFYAQEGMEEKRLTSVALFTHLWLLENGKWKLKRVLSYDHHSPENK